LRDATQGAARISWNSLRTPKKKCPRHSVRGHSRFLGRSGDRPPVGGISQSMESRPSNAQRANEPASRIGCASLRLSAMWWHVGDMV
jgi:hypothetical protein